MGQGLGAQKGLQVLQVLQEDGKREKNAGADMEQEGVSFVASCSSQVLGRDGGVANGCLQLSREFAGFGSRASG